MAPALALVSALMATQSPDPAVLAARERDWRCGPVVYQVFVDRFAPSSRLDAKRTLYAAPRSLRPWSEAPAPGRPDPAVGLWTHELAFWGGDLDSLRSKLSYVKGLGADVLYLNPIFDALTNHKYDTRDFTRVAPEYGTRQDLRELARDVHGRGMRLMLDGVFNHMGRTAPVFQDALKNPSSKHRSWFVFQKGAPHGYRAWFNVANLPELRLETAAVRDHLWRKADSVVQSYLREGVDGWRIDTAYELGPAYLKDLTDAAHRAKPDAAIIGEIWSYPPTWLRVTDGVMNFFLVETVRDLLSGSASIRASADRVERLMQDSPYEAVLRSWIVLDNHDTPRLRNQFPDADTRRLAQVLQFTLPGSPVIYYGTELGMEGAGDPANRGPMAWDLATDRNEELRWIKKLTGLRKSLRSLRVGDYLRLDAERLFAFLRVTDRVRDTAVVVVNPTSETVTERFPLRDGRIMSAPMREVLMGDRASVSGFAGHLLVTLPPRSARIYVPATAPVNGYTPYKRIGR